VNEHSEHSDDAASVVGPACANGYESRSTCALDR
jgi:hypothetical protein